MKGYRVLATAGLLISMTFVVPIAKANTMMSSMTSVKCPACGMQMTSMKTSTNTVPLLIHGKKYFCCAMCANGKKAASYDKAHPGKTFVAVK
jgi:hypothetical protein